MWHFGEYLNVTVDSRCWWLESATSHETRHPVVENTAHVDTSVGIGEASPIPTLDEIWDAQYSRLSGPMLRNCC